MLEKNRIFVIARYQENLDWINDLNGSFIIYNKSESFEYDFPRQDRPNYGRETESFIRFILQYYDELDNFESVVFLQGNPFEHCKSVLEKLQDLDDKSFEFLSDKNAKSTFPNTEYHSLHASTLCKLFDLDYDWDIQEFAKSDNENTKFLSNLRHYEHCISLCDLLKIRTENINFEWACGCQYQVPVKMIKNKSLLWWTNLYRIHVYFSIIRKTDFFSYVIESVFPLIFNFNQKGD